MSALTVKLTDFDHVDEVASFTFVGSNANALQSITIHANTFKKLFSSSPTVKLKEFEKPSELQKQFITAVKSEVKGDYVKWFEEVTNEYMKLKVNSNQE